MSVLWVFSISLRSTEFSFPQIDTNWNSTPNVAEDNQPEVLTELIALLPAIVIPSGLALG